MSKTQGETRSISRFFLAYLGGVAVFVGPGTPLVLFFTKALPRFACQSEVLTATATLAAFVLTAFMLFIRFPLLHALFGGRRRLAPSGTILSLVIGLILVTVMLLIIYIRAVHEAISALVHVHPGSDALSVAGCQEIPALGFLALYAGGFACLQLALVTMFFREYAQIILGLSDREVLHQLSGVRSAQGDT